MFDATTYRPDPLVVEGGNWMRNTLGLKPSQYSSIRIGDHLHMLNCMFDMVTLAAVVEPHASGYPKVTKTVNCHICQPPKPAPAPVIAVLELRNLTRRDREYNRNLVAVAMRAATTDELFRLHEGYRALIGNRATASLFYLAAGRRSEVTITTDSCAQVARALKAFAEVAA